MQSCQSIPELIDESGLEQLHQTTGNGLTDWAEMEDFLFEGLRNGLLLYLQQTGDVTIRWG